MLDQADSYLRSARFAMMSSRRDRGARTIARETWRAGGSCRANEIRPPVPAAV